jgi:hypothetical protein
VGLYVSISFLVYRARGFRDGAPRVQAVPTAIAPLKDMEICNQYIFSLLGARGVGAGWARARVLAFPFGIQLAVARRSSAISELLQGLNQVMCALKPPAVRLWWRGRGCSSRGTRAGDDSRFFALC